MFSYSNVQSAVLQVSVCSVESVETLSQCSVQVLCRALLPSPQVLLHVDQSPHEVNSDGPEIHKKNDNRVGIIDGNIRLYYRLDFAPTD